MKLKFKKRILNNHVSLSKMDILMYKQHIMKFEISGSCVTLSVSVVVVCPSIGSFSLEHGRWRIVNGSHYEYRTRIVFTCDPGYYRLGPAHIQCLPNGVWSWRNDRPHCQGESLC